MHHAMTSAALAFAALLTATAAQAAPGKPPPAAERGPDGPGKSEAAGTRGKSDEAPGKRDEAHGKRDEAHGKRDEAHGKSDEAHGKSGEAKPADPGARGNGGENRELRRKAHREALKTQFGADVLQRPPVAAELKTHAWRMARLERMRALAEARTDADKRKKTLERIDRLIEKEKARHDRQMEQLRNQNAGGPQ